jgi:lysophospholipase L1-like esterase
MERDRTRPFGRRALRALTAAAGAYLIVFAVDPSAVNAAQPDRLVPAPSTSAERPAPRPEPAPAPSAAVMAVHVAADAAALRGKTYVALGDSISEGKYAVGVDRIFPSRIADQLGMRLDLVAHSGARAAWALPRLGALALASPALVTIELGTNDVGFSTPPAVFSAQYETIVSTLARPTTRVLCIGSWLPSDLYDGIIREACSRHGGTFVSLSGFYGVNAFHAPDGWATFLGPSDWFHPGDQGHAAIAAAVLGRLPGYQGSDPGGLTAAATSTTRAPS